MRVLVGIYQEGEDDQQVPYAQPSGEPYDDATVDDEDELTVFVIYRDAREYQRAQSLILIKYTSTYMCSECNDLST